MLLFFFGYHNSQHPNNNWDINRLLLWCQWIILWPCPDDNITWFWSDNKIKADPVHEDITYKSKRMWMVWRNNNEIKSKYTQVEIYSPRMYLLPSRQGLEVRGKPQHNGVGNRKSVWSVSITSQSKFINFYDRIAYSPASPFDWVDIYLEKGINVSCNYYYPWEID